MRVRLLQFGIVLLDVKKYPLFFLLFLSLSPILPNGLISIGLILVLFSTILLWVKSKKQVIRRDYILASILSCLYYLALIVSAFYSTDVLGSLKGFQASVSLLVFPIGLILFLPKVSKAFFNLYLYGYVFSCLILMGAVFFYIIRGLAIDRFPELISEPFFFHLDKVFQYPYEFAISKAEKHLDVPFETHKVYISLQLLMGFFCALFLAQNTLNKWLRIMLLVVLFVLGGGIIYTQSLNSIFCLVFGLLVFFLTQFGLKNSLLVLVCSVILLTVFNPNGVLKPFDNKNTAAVYSFILVLLGKELPNDNIDKRLYIYKCSVDCVLHRPWFGYGVGNVQAILDQCYRNHNYVVAEFRSEGIPINSHNYYLHLWLSAGVFGVFSILLFFFYFFYKSLQKGYWLYFVFLIVFFIGLLTENLFVRMIGTTTFAIFHSVFFVYFIKTKE